MGKVRAAGLVLAALPAALAASCATTEPVSSPPHVAVSPEAADLSVHEAPPGASIGLEAEGNESDSLERLEALPGVRVRRVEPSGPAAAAGLRPGDVILSVDGVPVDDPDALLAAVSRAGAGREIRLEARRDTVAFEAGLVPRPARGTSPPRELYRADPVRTRAGYRTEAARVAGEPRMAAAIVRLFPGSPLPGEGFREGDLVIAIDGRPIASANDLVRRLLEDHAPGDPVPFEALRGGEVLHAEVRLWEPRRRLAKLAAMPLFHYSSSARPSRTQFSLIDLWIVSLFSYRRDEGEREYRFLSLIRFGTGRGELREEAPPAGEAP